MDNFFAKKGIALSRQPQAVPHNKQEIFKSSEQIHRQHISQTPRPTLTHYNPNQWGAPNPHFIHLPQQNDKSYSENPVRLNQQFVMPAKPTFSSITERREIRPQSIPKKEPYFLQQKVGTPRDSFIEMQNQSHSISTDDQTTKSFLVKPVQFQQFVPAKDNNQASNISLRSKLSSPSQVYLDTNSPKKSVDSSQEERQLKLQLQQSLLKQKIMSQAMKCLQQEKEELSRRSRDSSPTKNYWLDQKIKLMREIEEKTNSIRNLQNKLEQSRRQSKVKISMLEYEIKKLEGLKNRQQIENQNTRKLLEVERQKNDVTQSKMDKMVFFQDDLIHAKDYNKLKKDLDDVLIQNSKMYQDHQKFILEVGETRRKMNDELEKVHEELSKLKAEASQWRDKMERLSASSDDKRELIKLQHDINFLMKKIEQNREQLITRQHNLEEAHHQIKELVEKQNKRLESSQNILEGFNLKQFSETIALYESRIEDLNNSLFESKSEIQKQKKTIENLTGQLRRARQDKHINSMREKSYESSLKNDLMVLQQSYKSQQDLNRKKISALQENIQRKTREIGEKDKFIRQFLINRAKRIEQSSMKQILESVKTYFNVEEPQTELSQNPNAVQVDV